MVPPWAVCSPTGEHLGCLQVLHKSVWMWHGLGGLCMYVSWGVSRMAPAVENRPNAHQSLLAGQVLACYSGHFSQGSHNVLIAQRGGTSWHFASAVALCQPAVGSGRTSLFGGVKWWEENGSSEKDRAHSVEAKVCSLRVPDSKVFFQEKYLEHHIQGSLSVAPPLPSLFEHLA